MARGVDVLNISNKVGCQPPHVVGEEPCWADCDCAGLNADLESAADNGVLPVFALGNDRDPGVGTCNADLPALRRSGLSVGGIDSEPYWTNYDTSPTWATEFPEYGSTSRGGMTIRLWDGRVVQDAFAITDLAAPAEFSYWYMNPPYGYDTAGVHSGTSFAAPAVAGAAGMLREHFSSIGWTTDARVLLVNMLLMGDSYSYDFGGDRRYGMDPRSGAGRTHMHYPSSGNLTGPWGWGWHVFDITNSDVREFTVWDPLAESPLVRQWKVAMTWDESDYAAATDIVLEVWNKCPPGGGEALVSLDYSWDIRKRVELTQSEISNRCLVYRVRTFDNSMPPGQFRRVYVADYFHSGNPADH